MIDRRKFLVGAAGTAAASTAVASTAAITLGGLPASAAGSSRIANENAKGGSSAWKLVNPANDALTQIGGYTRQDSVKVGETVEICVLSKKTRQITALVFRLGWYGGSRARLMTTLSATAVHHSEQLRTDPTSGETDSRVEPSFHLTIPQGWESGIYLVRLVDYNDDDLDCHVTFVVKDLGPRDLLFAQPILTYAAYTDAPRGLGKSFYDGASGGELTTRGTQRATTVSLDRPYRSSGAGDLLRYEHDLVSWLEREAYDVSYITNLDVDRWPGILKRGKVAVLSGHDEYWTQRMRDGYADARDAGVNIANFGANNAYRRVKVTSSRTGRAKRLVTCFKGAPGEQGQTTGEFYDTSTPMQTLLGVEYMDLTDFFNDYFPIVPTVADHWFWEGTGALPDEPLPAPIMGYEVDRQDNHFPMPESRSYTLLASSPFDGSAGRNWCHTVLYQAPSGAWVFSGGTTSWGWGLIREGFQHSSIERATHNLLKRMLADSGNSEPTPVDGFEPFSSPEAFVDRQYLDFLDRGADAGGRNYWVGQVAAGGTALPAVIDRFLKSDEFAPRFEIARLYLAAFRRIPDAGGYDYWIGRHLDDAMSLADMAAFFSSSPEFQAYYGSPPDREFVRQIYVNVFGRGPDQTGWDFWTARLQSGMSRGELLVNFSQSDEGKAIYANRVYVVAAHQGLLRRPPSPNEYASWLKKLDNGQSGLSLIQAVYGSGEYANRF